MQGKTQISAEGYTQLNKYAGVSVLTPPTIMVGDRAVANPHMEYSAPGVLRAVHVRVIALGRTAVGSLAAVDYQLRWDSIGYFLEDLRGAQSKAGNAIRDCKESTYKAMCERGEGDTWAFVPDAVLGDDVVGLAIDFTHPEVTRCRKNYQNLVKFGERRARTIAVRNALRHHPAIAVSTVVPRPSMDAQGRVVDQEVRVPIWAWVEDVRMGAETRAATKALTQGAPMPDEIRIETMAADAIDEVIDEAEVVEDDGDGWEREKQRILDEERRMAEEGNR